ncbi:hypothetical protein AWW68_14260 [Roseivirga spongicola]|uniref:Uncharacterized protein n=1 Tax=Roseivirga spongicola TaxID=333140 RepID=A0A150X5A8_9BACT|nr:MULTISPECIES: hypothetical protein [Roseivirga]KYG73832.1 hypothetical protein AWW68_14260 [Roseivirga spongicola]MBO6660124.1 hypothetical protein [Roseivirga sp.]MBO6761792.1 hypothetical protein [Roseivirga sp.]MBO6907139.1 hypothetical protein [Roseivirga sp.]
MSLKQATEIGKILLEKVGYEKTNIIEMMIEEFRFDCKTTAMFIRSTFKEENAQNVAELLLLFFLKENILPVLQDLYTLSEAEASALFKKDTDYKIIHTTVKKIRANDFGFEYRCYLLLDNAGNGIPGWGYFIPDTPEANFMMDLALKAVVNKQTIYVYGRQDKDNKKFRILELGLKEN